MSADKLRFRFTKTGDLRFVSHLDLLRCGERMLRRANLPYKSTAGFHPQPRLIFALSLPLGVAGRNEVLELELTQPVEPEATFAQLNTHAPPGMAFTSVNAVPMKASAVPRRVVYRFDLPKDKVAETKAIVETVLAQDKVWISRYKPRPRQVNIRPYLNDIRTAANALELDLWVTTTGTARADELIELLGLTAVWRDGASLERLTVEIVDEVPIGTEGGPPTEAAETRPILVLAANAAAREPQEISTPHATWGLSPNGPEVE